MARAFILTPQEKRCADLMEQGKNAVEIMRELGTCSSRMGYLISTTTEKVRLQKIQDKRFYGTSSLAKARGSKRMVGTK